MQINLFFFTDPETGKRLTYKELIINSSILDNSQKLAFIYIDNNIHSLSVFFTLFNNNTVLALLNPQLKIDYKENLEQIYKPDIIFDLSRKHINNYKNCEFGNQIIYLNKNSKNRSLNPNLKLLLSTSGTTGSPKFVKLSENNLVQNALSIIDYLPIQKTDVTPLNLPIYYSYGLSVLTTNAIAGGNIVCSNSDIVTRKFWDEFETFGYSSFAGVPFTYEMLNRIGFTKKTYPSLKYFTQAGGKLSENLAKMFVQYSIDNTKLFYIMYGQTEATARMSYLQPGVYLEKTGSIGKPIKNGKFIIDQDTNELCYKGPNVFGGYAENIADLETFDSPDILRTGDVASVDNEGYYYIVGRLKRFSKVFGLRINLDEIENILKNKFTGIVFACTGINDKFLLISHNQLQLKSEEITIFLKNELNIHPSVLRIVYLDPIPLTSNGKINYNQIIADYGNE